MSVVKAEALMEAYQRIKIPKLIHRAVKEKSKSRIWQPPLQNWFKVNVDSTISNEKQLLGLGLVIWDSDGKAIAIAIAIKIAKFYGDLVYAEAEVASWGLHVVKNVGLASLIIKLDSQMVVDKIG